VGDRAAGVFPFALAVILPPAGLMIGLFQLQQDRQLGIRLIAVAILAAVVWALLFLA
jgi:hypothetical protein